MVQTELAMDTIKEAARSATSEVFGGGEREKEEVVEGEEEGQKGEAAIDREPTIEPVVEEQEATQEDREKEETGGGDGGGGEVGLGGEQVERAVRQAEAGLSAAGQAIESAVVSDRTMTDPLLQF